MANFPDKDPNKSLGALTGHCAQLARDQNDWANVLGALAAYGKALKGLADVDSVDVKAELDSIRSGLAASGQKKFEGDQAKAAVSAASALVKLIMDEVRRAELGRFVTNAEPHIQSITTQLTARVREEVSLLDAIETELRNNQQDLLSSAAKTDTFVCRSRSGEELECDSPKVRVILASSLVLLDAWILERRRALARLGAAIEAFGKSHNILAKNAAGIGREDAEDLRKVLSAVKDIYDSWLKVATCTCQSSRI